MPTHDYINIRRRHTTRDEEGHYIIIKELLHQEDITILSETAPNIRAS